MMSRWANLDKIEAFEFVESFIVIWDKVLSNQSFLIFLGS